MNTLLCKIRTSLHQLRIRMTTRPPGTTILLVDDESLAEDFFRASFADHPDVALHYLSDPTRTADTVRAVGATVVVVDLRMPVLDGFEVIAALRADPATAELPIILMSSVDDAETKAQGFARGANDYLVKWPDPRELEARVRYHSAAWQARRERDHAFNALRASQQELAQSQAALHQSQKMEAIGQLTGGVAHDFNNVLQIIGGNLQLLKLVGGVNEAGRARIDTALAGVERGARLSAHLLAFARRQPLQSVLVDAGEVVRGMEELLRRLVDARIEIGIDIDPQLWPTSVDPSQLHNVLLNLCINARDAMPQGGTLALKATNVGQGSSLLCEVGDGDFVMLEVRDSGSGMAPDVLERAFEPFFTTKPAGQGTGLGLSMAYGFVKQTGGEILLRSDPGKGTSVRIFLHRASGTPVLEPMPSPALVEGGMETILVVEDEPEVRKTTVELLSALGYQVLEAADADVAAAIVKAGTPIDLVFSDVVMPGDLTAVDLAELVRETLPDTQVLFTSGYPEGVISHGGKLDPTISLLQKPYQADVLAARIRHLLRRRTAALKSVG
jgi:signal transduction histidine kinase